MERYIAQRVYPSPFGNGWEYGTRVGDIGKFNTRRECDKFIRQVREQEKDARFLVTENEPVYGGGYWEGIE